MRFGPKLACLASLIALAGIVAVPATAGAKARSSDHTEAHAKAQRTAEAKQNAALRKQAKAIAAARKIIHDLGILTSNLGFKNKSQDTDLGETESSLASLKATVDAIVAGVPAIVDGLNQLKNGLTAAGAGINLLVANLTSLADAYKAVEYGVAKVSATNAVVAAGSMVTSADVPDDGNVIDVNGTALLVAQATPVSVNLRADIRSNEGDNGVGSTVGQAGGFVYVKSTQQTFTDNDANGGDGSETVVQKVGCTGGTPPVNIFGTLPGDSIVTPSGTVNNLSLKNLPGGVLRTDTTHPDGSSTSLLPAACSFTANPGEVYEVYYNVSFVDIPTSTTPGGTE